MKPFGNLESLSIYKSRALKSIRLQSHIQNSKKTTMRHHLIILISGLVLASSLNATAWTLDNTKSTVDFISIKNSAFGESHTFGELNGEVTEGIATVDISTASIDTKIDIRNDRMQKHLFETEQHPLITINATVSEILEQLEDASNIYTELPITVSVRGTDQKYTASISATKLDDGSSLTVNSVKPVLVGAADFELNEGIAMLAKLAGGIQIAESVPVSFSLVFSK